MRRALRILLPVLILLLGFAIAVSLMASGPQATRKRPKPAVPRVEVLTLHPQDYEVMVASRGTLTPRTSTSLVPEVSGRIIQVANNFKSGAFFAADDLLLQIDPRDYENAVTIAQATLAQKRLDLAEELARSTQALRDWQNLNLQGDPTPLSLRAPQRKNTEAALKAAQAQLNQTKLELERTRIRAPYAGRILSKKVDLGQYVAAGTAVAEIFSSDAMEIRLPLSSADQRYLNLPETYQNDNQPTDPEAKVIFDLRVADQTYQWQGRLVRTESAVDSRSRQLFVVAQIDHPYQKKTGRPALKVGQFVEAHILGQKLKGVYVIPRSAVRGEKTVQLLDADMRLQRRKLKVIWQDAQHLIASGPLQDGDQLCLTALPFAADGIQVEIASAAAESQTEQSGRKD